jgi:N4-gp56 family major capsid protein
MCIERVYAAEGKIVFRWAVDSTTATAWASDRAGTPTLVIVPGGGAANGDEVHATIVYGQNAFGLVKLGGKGKPNIQIIVKPVGSSGDADPLNQRGSIAWKVKHFACAVLQDDFIVRVEHGVSD